MDGDVPDLPALIALKRRHKCFLMVDEAHALGVLGRTGRGVAEHFGSDPRDVDIWMGTLSKTLASCGGYVAGERALVGAPQVRRSRLRLQRRHRAAPAAASLTALGIMRREPERVERLQENGRLFLKLATEAGLDTGTSRGFSIIPAITGSSLKAVRLSGAFFEHGINVQPVIHPAVEEKAARLRFFLTETHTEADMRLACETAKKLIYQGTRI
jgi:7-keto-8-aminopelargonate synthetase-like enzyme